MNKPARLLSDRIHQIRLDMIAEADRLRPVNPDRVREIKASWELTGQLTPIEVGPADKNGIHTLVFGSHRLAVARELGEPTIAAMIIDAVSDDVRRLREIDENLYRAELSPFDQAVFLAARKEIYERLHPEAGHGKAAKGKDAKIASLPRARGFAADVAERIGLAERTVQLALTRFDRLTDESRRRLRGTKFSENGVEIDALCKRTPQQQSLILDMVLPASGEPKAATIREAAGVIMGRADPAAPDPETIARRLESLFWKLPKGKARKDFAAWAKANIDRDPADAA